jgi:adenylylsulfate kinase
MTETRLRSLFKAISWRVFATTLTGTLVFLFTHKVALAVSVGLLDSLLKILAYFLHERLWATVRFGRKAHQLEDIEISGRITEEDKEIIKQKLRELGYIDD